MKTILLHAVLICSTLQTFSQDKQSRDQTITYINTILEKTIGLKYNDGVATESYFQPQTIYLRYNSLEKTYSIIKKYQQYIQYLECESLEACEYRKFTFKNFSTLDFNISNKKAPINFLTIYFRSKEVSVVHNKRFIYNENHCTGNTDWVERIYFSKEIEIPFPTGDPDDVKRLKNAFLRLKEIDAEIIDPFLD